MTLVPQIDTLFISMRSIRIGDILLALLSLSAIIWISVGIYSDRGRASEVQIRTDEALYVYDLLTDASIVIPGPLGDTHIEIHDAHVHVSESPCKSKICIAAGEISKTGEWIICLPNRVFITIEGEIEADGEVDDVVF